MLQSQISPGQLNAFQPVPRLESRMKTRSNAMVHARRKQKDVRRSRDLAYSDTAGLSIDQLSGAAPATAGVGASNILVQDQAIVPQPMQGALPDRESSIGEAEEHSDGDCDESDWGESQIFPPPHSVAFFRYTIAQLFGASLIGSSTKSVRSDAVVAFRRWVATSSPPAVLAVDDTMSLLLPACTLNDPRLLLEARKRHLVATRAMKIALKTNVYDLESLLTCAMELFFVDLFRPIASGLRGLYDGFIHLTQTHLHELRSSPSPTASFLRVQMRHAMLMESLAARSALPVSIELWDPLPGTLQLLPQMTESLMQLAIQLPGLLTEAYQARGATVTDPDAVERALSSFLEMERKLLQWQAQYCTEVSAAVKKISFPRSSKDFSMKDKGGVTGNVTICPEKPALSAYCQAMCYICLLFLREGVAELYTIRGNDILKDYYTEHATLTADTLCRLTVYLIEEEDGLLGKAVAARGPLHFAHQWYEKNNDLLSRAWVMEHELRVQKQVPFLSWHLLLPLSLLSLYMQG